MSASTDLRRLSRLALLRIVGSGPRPAWPRNPRSILIVRPDHLGDLVLATAALPALRQAFPQARLTAWVGPWGQDVWRGNGCIDAIEVCPFPGFTRVPKPNPWQPYLLAESWARRLAGRYDLALNLRPDFWWGAMAASRAGIAVAGYDLPECRPFLALRLPHVPLMHETDRNLRLVAAVACRAGAEHAGGQRQGNGPRPAGEDCRLFPEAELPSGLPAQAIAIHPGAGAAVKLWRESAWAETADALGEEAPIVFTAGSDDEEAQVDRIRRLMRRSATLAGRLPLADLAGFYRRCRLVIAPDCGPLHLARAMETATVGLFGPTDPVQFGPRDQASPKHAVVRLGWPCIPCRRLDYTGDELALHPCVSLLEPREVIGAARRVLDYQKSRA